jgi:hypothetical protein
VLAGQPNAILAVSGLKRKVYFGLVDTRKDFVTFPYLICFFSKSIVHTSSGTVTMFERNVCTSCVIPFGRVKKLTLATADKNITAHKEDLSSPELFTRYI